MPNVPPPPPLIISNQRKLAPVAASLPHPSIAIAYGKSISQVGYRKRFVVMAQSHISGLTSLELRSRFFLGWICPASANPCLGLHPISGFTKPLSAASNLIQRHLNRIPNPGYISPDAMVACVLTMNNLELFTLEYRSTPSSPRPRRRPPPSARVVLPSLTRFLFHGASEYLEDFLAQVGSLQLNFFHITSFNQLAFGLSQLPQFISRSGNIKTLTQTTLVFYNHLVEITFSTRLRRQHCSRVFPIIFVFSLFRLFHAARPEPPPQLPVHTPTLLTLSLSFDCGPAFVLKSISRTYQLKAWTIHSHYNIDSNQSTGTRPRLEGKLCRIVRWAQGAPWHMRLLFELVS